jgi:Domain of unknown function (DUF4926)
MQNTLVKLLDVVALLGDKPEEGLVAGQVGTVVEVLAPGVFEVEFLDSLGRTVVLAELRREELLALKHEAAVAA